ncbi:MAG: hypothetical protein KC609_22935, partial [Myxococcales bacterium]|nr:hypothetical protein [Myxococcales bacterium]
MRMKSHERRERWAIWLLAASMLIWLLPLFHIGHQRDDARDQKCQCVSSGHQWSNAHLTPTWTTSAPLPSFPAPLSAAQYSSQRSTPLLYVAPKTSPPPFS